MSSRGASAASAAKFGHEAMLRGELRAIDDWRLRYMLNWVFPWLPNRTKLEQVKKMQVEP